ncbi:MAG: lipopolysaccharide kinase InaA family protein [Azoarcus sp.]|jgi:hypothetical protein|nr:lipopolysaccharide kinase InaA family protein [Azoarcus sp.]
MEDFFSPADRTLLEPHGLASFDALWNLNLARVDDPNIDRGGVSEVFRLDLDGQGYYLKRQCKHLTRSFAHPCGEPTFAREFRNVRHLHAHGVPTMDIAFFAQRRLPGKGSCAILLTRELSGWQSMAHWLGEWDTLSGAVRERMLTACGEVIRRLHAAKLIHCCLYPEHVFVHAAGEGCEAALIDLEKARHVWLGRNDYCRDVEQFLRRSPVLSSDDAGIVLAAYLGGAPEGATVADWRRRLAKRREHKNNDS